MKAKPMVKNELILEDVLTLNDEGQGLTLRVVVIGLDLIQMTVHNPQSDKQASRILLLFTPEQIDQIYQLRKEWIDDEG